MGNRKKTGKRRIIRFGYMILMALFTTTVYLAGRSGIFSIKEISCRVDGEKGCLQEINAELNQYIGKNLLFVRKAEIEKRIISADRLAETVKVNLRLPATLGVKIIPRKAAAAITTADESREAVEVDKEGIILGKTDDVSGLPRLIWPEISQWPIENRVPENIVRAAVIASLAGERFQLEGIASIDSGDSGSSAPVTMVLRIKSGEKVWLSLSKDPVEQLATLQVVLNQAKIEGRMVGEIDMRFERPVIREAMNSN